MNTNDPILQAQVKRLYRLIIYGRWLTVGLLWVSVGFFSIWSLRREIFLWLEHFTWVAVRYALIYNRLPTLGISLCLGMTTAVLVWQSRHIIWGIPPDEQKRLEKQVRQINIQGPTHPLWKWIIQDHSH